MMRSLFWCCCVFPLVLAACGGDQPKSGAPAGGGSATGTMDDHGHGDEKPLGPLTIGPHTFDVVQLGDVAAGKEAVFELEFAAGRPLPATVRGWVGVESGQGSRKARFGKEGDAGLHAHLEVPKALPDGSRLWLEIEESGQTQRGSIAWK